MDECSIFRQVGLRDVMDDPDVLREEWERKRVNPALDDIYDDIWVFGLQEIFDPLEGIGVSAKARRKAALRRML